MPVPVDVDFMSRRRFAGLWEVGRAGVQPATELISGERVLREFYSYEGTYVLTNSRLIRTTGGVTESIWVCLVKGFEFPERSLGDPREEIVVTPKAAILAERKYVLIAGNEPVRERSATKESMRMLGVVEGLLGWISWCKHQHDHRPQELEKVGLVHAPSCPHKTSALAK